MRSHFSLPRRMTAACAVAGATTLLNGNCSGQTFIAADYATNSIYAAGWSAGQNGGYGFGPWSFDGTDTNPPAGPYQGMSTSSPLGTSWTLLTYANHTGLADAGRAISEPGGLQPGQTFEAVIDNPTGYYFYRGFDILFLNATDNNPGGYNSAALRMSFFSYAPADWVIVDGSGYPPGSPNSISTPLDNGTTGAAGMKFDFSLTSTNTYWLTMTPLSNPSDTYTNAGQLLAMAPTSPYTNTITTNLPINWVNFRLYWGTSSGLTDTADNFEISSMTIAGPLLNIQVEGMNAVLSWPGYFSIFNLAYATNLASPVWSTNLPPPAVVNGQNVVTNPIAGAQQFYRLQQ